MNFAYSWMICVIHFSDILVVGSLKKMMRRNRPINYIGFAKYFNIFHNANFKIKVNTVSRNNTKRKYKSTNNAKTQH